MVRFTAAVILECPQVTTPLGERALVVRGKGLQMLEAHATGGGVDPAATAADSAPEQRNLRRGGASDLLYDVACNFDVLDLSDNALQRVEGFNFSQHSQGLVRSILTVAPRLSTLILHNNNVNRVSADAIRSLAPTLHTFVAHNNNFTTFEELDVFGLLPNLERLSLVGNAVAVRPQYRLYVIARCAQTKLKSLDLNRVLDAERNEAKTLKLPPSTATSEGATAKASKRAARRGDFDGVATSALAALGAVDAGADNVPPEAVTGKRCRAENNSAARQPLPAAAAANVAAVAKLTEEELAARMAELERRLEEASSSAEVAQIEQEMEALLNTQQ